MIGCTMAAIDRMEVMEMTPTNRSGRAVVLGAGMAGLLSARVLAEHFDDVVIIERDELPVEMSDRPGAIQGRHVHTLLARGQQVMEALYPGLTGELIMAGAHVDDVLKSARMCFSGHRLQPADSGLVMISASRACIEAHVRARTLSMPTVRVVDGCDASGLVTDPTGRRVVAVRLLRRVSDSAEESMPADLVVDATGRNSRAPAWLESIGFDPPPEERVVVDVAYATRRYRMGRDALAGDVAIINAPTPERPRGGGLALLEDDVGMLTLIGILGDRPPLDPDGFDEFAASLQFPDIHNATATAEPLDDPVPHRFPASTWRHYERVRRHPDGFAVIGDAVCSLNPIYAQGMSVAALSAEALGRHLAARTELSPRRHYRQLARLLRPPWEMATGADLMFPGVEGRRTRIQGAIGVYVTRLHAAAAHDSTLSRAFARVAALVDPPTALLRPSIVGRVLRG